MRLLFLPAARRAKAEKRPLVVGHWCGESFKVFCGDKVVATGGGPADKVAAACDAACRGVAIAHNAIFGGIANVINN